MGSHPGGFLPEDPGWFSPSPAIRRTTVHGTRALFPLLFCTGVKHVLSSGSDKSVPTWRAVHFISLYRALVPYETWRIP